MNISKPILLMTTLYCVSGLLGLSLQAHTPYLQPLSFEAVNGNKVTLDASFAEQFFVPDVAFNNSEFFVLGPDGKRSKPDTVVALKTRIVVEHEMQEKGTYRFSTGKRMGRVFKVYEKDGERHTLENPEDPVPAGGKLLSFFQSITLAETYVTHGGPSDTVLRANNSGLEMLPLSHPNDLFVGESMRLKLQFDGKIREGQKVDVYLARDQFGDETPSLTLTSNAAGEIDFKPASEGVYLLRARYRVATGAKAKAPEYSYTYTLTLEAVK